MKITNDRIWDIKSRVGTHMTYKELQQILNNQRDVKILQSIKKDRDVAVEEWQKCEDVVEHIKKHLKLLRTLYPKKVDGISRDDFSEEILLKKMLRGEK